MKALNPTARGRSQVLVAVAALMVVLTGCSAADATAPAEATERYEAALAPLKKRSDVLERKFASVQGEGYQDPEALRRVLAEIIPEYARLLEAARAIEVEGAGLEQAHGALVASLERQQNGLELALRGIGADDRAMLAGAGRELEKAQRLVERHRRLLEQARGADGE